MIDYKLAEELKDAGFKCSDEEHKNCWIGENYVKNPKDVVCNPSLSNIIEACGDGVFNLMRTVEGVWEATKQKNLDNIKIVIGLGKTSEESVTKLYIALNKKEA